MPTQRSVHCRDTSGRRRELTVASGAAEVTVTLPSGERAVFTPLEIGRLRAALREAAVEATTEADAAVWRGHGRG